MVTLPLSNACVNPEVAAMLDTYSSPQLVDLYRYAQTKDDAVVLAWIESRLDLAPRGGRYSRLIPQTLKPRCVQCGAALSSYHIDDVVCGVCMAAHEADLCRATRLTLACKRRRPAVHRELVGWRPPATMCYRD